MPVAVYLRRAGCLRLPDYQPDLLAIALRGVDGANADPAVASRLTGFDRWQFRPLYSDFSRRRGADVGTATTRSPAASSNRRV